MCTGPHILVPFNVARHDLVQCNPLQIWYRDGGWTRLRMEYKTTPKWAWPGSRDLISKFWDPPNNF